MTDRPRVQERITREMVPTARELLTDEAVDSMLRFKHPLIRALAAEVLVLRDELYDTRESMRLERARAVPSPEPSGDT